jgi:hypothetical protein
MNRAGFYIGIRKIVACQVLFIRVILPREKANANQTSDDRNTSTYFQRLQPEVLIPWWSFLGPPYTTPAKAA